MKNVEINEYGILVNGNMIYVDKQQQEAILDGSQSGNTTLSQFQAMQKIPGLIAAVGLPDIHSGYAFPIGSAAAIDLNDQNASVSPEGVGFDINCGVRCLVTNLKFEDIQNNLEKIADMLALEVPSGLPSPGAKPIIDLQTLNGILDGGLPAVSFFPVSPEDILLTESKGSLPGCSRSVGQKAKAKGLLQLGSLGSGNHYLEIQVVDEIVDHQLAESLGISLGQVLISIHTGSRGLGHSVCSDFVNQTVKKLNDEKMYAGVRNKKGNDAAGDKVALSSQVEENNGLLFVRYHSEAGQNYISLMNSASNFAWVNRAFIAHKARECFAKVIEKCQIKLLCDVSHNIASVEINGRTGGPMLVHRKGAAKVLPPGHDSLPDCFSSIGQPVLVGGSMGTCSYVVIGAEGATDTFYSTCHGAGRLLSRSQAAQTFTFEGVTDDMRQKGIIFRGGSTAGMVEEACGCYKDVEKVVRHSERVGITKTVVRVRPIIVIKG